MTDEERLQLILQGIRQDKNIPEQDREIMKREDWEDFLRVHLRSTREAFAHGFDAAAQDGRVMSIDYGFRLEDIRSDLPFFLWYGTEDKNVPVNVGVQVAARLGGRANLRVEDGTHNSVQLNWKEEQLQELLKGGA